MITKCLMLGLPPSGPAPYRPSCSRRGDCWNDGGTKLLKLDFFRGGVSIQLTCLGRLVTGTESACPFSGARMMTGKGRTYPGGVTKWQWKRRQFKEDRKLELKRLSRDRKLYRCRRREELKDAHPGISSDTSVDESSTGDKGMSINLITIPDSTTRGENLYVGVPTGGAIQGRQNSEIFQVDWSASKDDELQQIRRVRSLLRSKAVQLSPPKQKMTASSFERLQLSAPSLKALHKVVGLPSMTRVQEATLPTILRGKDLLIRTLGGTEDIVTSLVRNLLNHAGEISANRSMNSFHLFQMVVYIRRLVVHLSTYPEAAGGSPRPEPPSVDGYLSRKESLGLGRYHLLHGVEVALQTPRHMTVSGRHSVHVLLVCPTREQVEVAGAEARKLLTFHTGIRLQAVMGGNDIKEEMSRLRSSPCERCLSPFQMLVATPGRLLANLRESAEFWGQLRGLKLLVLPDVQMLLDMGYQKTIQNIISLLPRTRQTLMWSRTLSDEVNTLSHYSLKKDRAVINTFEGEAADIAQSVGKQEYVLVPMKMHLALIYRELKTHFEHEPKGKVVLFCQTIRTTTFMAELFKNLGFYTREVHVRKKEDVRARVAAEFRTSQEGMILFTSGASVWGVANPDVTLIIQVGSPSARQQYARRVTPTGPTTRQRDCMLILMPHEKSFVKQLVDLSVSESANLEVGPGLELEVQRALEGVDYQIRAKAYVAWLRYHFTKESTDSGKEETTRLASVYASALGFKNPPMVSRKTVAQLGLQKFLLSPHS